jgi:multidrug transporter EmrE-like cation transporter
MAWLFLLIAGLCEPAWAIGLKYTEGFSRLLPTIGTVAGAVRDVVGIRCGAISGNMKVSFQAARSIG